MSDGMPPAMWLLYNLLPFTSNNDVIQIENTTSEWLKGVCRGKICWCCLATDEIAHVQGLKGGQRSNRRWNTSRELIVVQPPTAQPINTHIGTRQWELSGTTQFNASGCCSIEIAAAKDSDQRSHTYPQDCWEIQSPTEWFPRVDWVVSSLVRTKQPSHTISG